MVLVFYLGSREITVLIRTNKEKKQNWKFLVPIDSFFHLFAFFFFCYFSLFFRTYFCLFGLSNQKTFDVTPNQTINQLNVDGPSSQRWKWEDKHTVVKPGLYKTQRTRVASYGIRLERLCTVEVLYTLLRK